MHAVLLLALFGIGPALAADAAAAFRHANALEAAGEKDAAYAEFTQLVKSAPEDPYLAEAWLHIGEYWFDRDDFAKAHAAYKHALERPNGDREGFASYKLAWCEYNLGDYPLAIATMVAVVDSTKTAPQIREEALKDLVRFYSDGGEGDAATEFFAAHGRPDLTRDTAVRSAAWTMETGVYDWAIRDYRAAIALDLNHPRNPELQAAIVDCFRKLGKVEETWAALEVLLASYSPASDWARANAADPKVMTAALEEQERALRTFAVNVHTEAKKLRKGEDAQRRYAYAEQGYARYIVLFSASSNIGEMRYAYAELLYARKKFAAAYEQYMAVVALDPKGTHAKFCAESAIFAADELLDGEMHRNGGAYTSLPKNAPIPLEEWAEKSILALDQFARLYPDDPKASKVIYKSAYLLYNHNHFTESAVRFRQVIAMSGWTKESEQAANLTLDGLLLVEDWAALRDTAGAFYDQPGFGTPAFKAEMLEIVERAGEKVR
ncbi:hypothetical protein LBMAG42_10540 [Deltaproteobacteria bacterium]|nr:hypothetical protein LBMAG42_10540 [Deltaproteobacteria bacterium]